VFLYAVNLLSQHLKNCGPPAADPTDPATVPFRRPDGLSVLLRTWDGPRERRDREHASKALHRWQKRRMKVAPNSWP